MTESSGSSGVRIAVVIPALNEEDALPRVLQEIPPGLAERIVVVDNGSTDQTTAAALANGAEAISEPRRGYGSACLAGLEHVRKTGAPEIVVFLDADYSDHPGEMPDLVAPILMDEAELVIGSRVLGKAAPGALLPQARYGNALATTLIRWRWGVEFTDLGPFRAIRWAALETLAMQEVNFGWTVEMQVKAARQGLRCKEIPVSYRKRVGSSKITGTLRGTIGAGTRILWLIGKEAIRLPWTR